MCAALVPRKFLALLDHGFELRRRQQPEGLGFRRKVFIDDLLRIIEMHEPVENLARSC